MRSVRLLPAVRKVVRSTRVAPVYSQVLPPESGKRTLVGRSRVSLKCECVVWPLSAVDLPSVEDDEATSGLTSMNRGCVCRFSATNYISGEPLALRENVRVEVLPRSGCEKAGGNLPGCRKEGYRKQSIIPGHRPCGPADHGSHERPRDCQ